MGDIITAALVVGDHFWIIAGTAVERIPKSSGKKRRKKSGTPLLPESRRGMSTGVGQSVCLWVCVEGEEGSLNHFCSQIWERKKRGLRGVTKNGLEIRRDMYGRVTNSRFSGSAPTLWLPW